MSARKKPGNFVQRLHRKIRQLFNAVTKAFVNWILRSLLLLQRRTRLSQAGFVLPTVVMVILVVILLTTAILIRSFDRSKNASNYRVNEVVLNAASPALDRARSKLNYLFSPDETALKGNTPDETSIAQVFELPRYTFGDETPLKVVYDSDGGGVDPGTPTIPSKEQLKTAWKFPVDTDNNGKFDSFTLYGIYYRTPEKEDRARSPLEARARPQFTGAPNACTAANGGGGGSSGEDGWYSISGQLKKAFFTYVATVPISTDQFTKLTTTGYKDITNVPNKFEAYKGNKGFSALEMQQDQTRLALDNNAVFYEDDLIITDVPADGGFKLNGRVQTNGNLMLGSNFGEIAFYQVSSPWSCFYNAENSKIIVGGNVSANGIAGTTDTANLGNDNAKVHLFKQPEQAFDPNGAGNSGSIKDGNVTTNQAPGNVAYNIQANDQRLNVLVTGGMTEYDAVNAGVAPTPTTVKKVTRFPSEISENFNKKYPTIPLKEDEARNLLEQVLQTYFKERIRGVPFAEVPINQPELGRQVGGAPVSGNNPPPTGETYVFGGGGEIMAPKEWMQIDPAITKLPLKFNGTTMELEQTDPTDIPVIKTEYNIGDRVLVGNGLPYRWWDDAKNKYAEPKAEQPVLNGGSAINWNNTGGGEKGGSPRQRTSQIKILDDLGNTSRNGFWEKAAADPSQVPGDEELAGGLRIVTGAGIYVDGTPPGSAGVGRRIGETTGTGAAVKSGLPEPTVTPKQLQALNAEIDLTKPTLKPNRVVWPDTMPMYLPALPPSPQVFKGDLQMRATVVYHYASPTPDQPIACISSYYDPTNADTAKNNIAIDPVGGTATGRSNNGINYQPPTAAARVLNLRLRKQAYMLFPDGRWVNEPLKDAVEALQKGVSGNDLSFDQKAAIDAANCALTILDGASPTAGPMDDGAIRERAFLDPRQVKTLHKPDVEFDANGITFTTTNPPIARETKLIDATTKKVLIADPEQLKIATQASLNSSIKQLAEYSLPIEQRQPLEIRVTEIDVEKLRTKTFGTTKTGKPDYLLPMSGIIYATRDDALPDISDRNITDQNPLNRVDGGSSATDFKLDSGRRPNGIRLVSSDPNGGGKLSRGTTNNDNPEEKGLILASNLPVYIKGDFNRHYVFGSTTPTEEFSDPLDANYVKFYTRQAPFDKNFACRRGSKAGCNPGDQWRAARILSDAITLLSNNFRDGYRNEANYDFNNNAGNLAVATRLKNGFWWNGFATNYVYKNDTATANLDPQYPINADFNPVGGTEEKGSSYVMNGVTPIQRRVNGFPEYQMEICPKVPVSACSPQDWITNDTIGGVNRVVGGSTAAPDPADTTDTWRDIPQKYSNRDYPRRVAFQRNQFGQLVLDPINDAIFPVQVQAIPMGIISGTPREIKYRDSGVANNPQNANNALWFATTSVNNSEPNANGFDYNSTANNSRLYYLPDDPEEVPTERQMLNPGVPKFPFDLKDASNLYNQRPFIGTTNSGILNGKTGFDPSDFSVCIMGYRSRAYKPKTSGGSGGCPASAVTSITAMWNALYLLNDTYPFTKVTPLTVPISAPIRATTKVNVVDLSSNDLTGQTITLSSGGQTDPIFVIRGAPITNPIKLASVTLALDGVDPNNIFWISKSGMIIEGGQLAGNFIGSPNGRLRMTDPNGVLGARFLGFGQGLVPAGASLEGMTALTTTAQPLLLPVLQLHSPKGTPGDDPGTAFASDATQPADRKWLQKATPTQYYATLIMGDSPSRPYPSGGGENGGGLHNFPRFIENWTGVDATLRGSLIQYIKSKYATGPFDTVDLVAQDNSLFFDSALGTAPPYITGGAPNVAPDPLGYQYSEAAARNKAPYYQPPIRKWGYDVGLLSQTADLFSRRFAIPSAGTPNEFYREVSRDDTWIQNLLCAAEKTGTTYERTIADDKQRPACLVPLSDYNDPT